MGRTTETKVIIGAETKGFVRAGQEAAKITKAAAAAAKEQLKNTKEVEKELGRMGGQLKDLARHQVSLNREMEKVGKATDTYKKLSGQLKEVNKQQDELQRAARNVERAFKDQGKAVTAAQMAKGGFAQGFIQGAVPGVGPFIQRGPGMRQQAAGMAIGRGIRGVGAAATGAAFGGMQGLVNALQSVPVAGILAAPISMAMQQAQQAIQYQQVKMGAMPFMGGLGFAQRRRQALATTRAKEVTPEDVFLAYENEPLKQLYNEKTIGTIKGARVARRAAEFDRPLGGMGPGGIRGLGERYGMALPQVMQFAASLSQAAGGTGMTRQQQRLRETAIAAQVGYQVDPGVAGAFGLGGRRGGLVGGGGRAASAMVDAMQDATKLGLEGSELNDYLRQIAEGINSWKSTGIPFNKSSMMELSTGLGAVIGGVRGMRIAGATRQMGIKLGGQGPQTLGELMMLRSLTGMQRGASQEDIWKAQIRAQEQEFVAGGLRKGIMGLIAGGGGGVSGLRAAYPEAAKFGISKRELTMMYGLETEGLTPETAKWMGQTPAGLSRAVEFMGGGRKGRRAVRGRLAEAGVTMTKQEMLKRLGEAPEVGGVAEALKTPEALAAAAKGVVPSALRELAKLTNLQIKTGEVVAADLKKIDASVQRVSKEIIDFLKPVFSALGVNAEEMTKALGAGPGGLEIGPE